MKPRSLEIDTLRGVACILLVICHVIGFTPVQGLQLSEGFLREANDLLAYIRMPLFTFLSGYVYAYRPFRADVFSFLKGKARRLIVPMLVVGTIFAIVQTYLPGTNGGVQNWWLLHIKPYAHFWFVESLFLIFLVIVPLEMFRLLGTTSMMAAVILFASLLYISGFGFIWFSFSGAIYLFPFFLLGIALYRFSAIEHCQQYRAVFYVAGIIAAVLPAFIHEQNAQRTLLSLLVGGTVCFALLMTQIKVVWLAKVGEYSYAIYLYHVFFTAACRIFFKKLGIDHLTVMFVLGALVGLLGPIVVEIIATRYSAAQLLLLGKRAKKKPRSNDPESGQVSQRYS